jgi:hypothetical protein
MYTGRRSFKDRGRFRTLVHGRTNLTPSKDTRGLIKPKDLDHGIADLRRESFENWLAASERAKKLRIRGYDVTLPPPYVGRPQFLRIKTPRS